MLRVFLFALVLLSFALAKIASPVEDFFLFFGKKPTADHTLKLEKGEVKLESLDGLLYRVHYVGPKTAFTEIAQVVAAALGEPGAIENIRKWFEQNLAALEVQTLKHPVSIRLANAYELVVQVQGDRINMTVAPYEVPESAFGEPRHVLGEKGVMIREYSDFYCPYCQKLALEVLPEIKKKLVEPGKARFEYRHFPLIEIHPDAFQAAEASECAAEQGKFWPYHDLLFATLREKKGVDYVALAKELGLDTEKFSTCLKEGRYRPVVEAMRAEAEALGLQGTPSVFVGPFLLPNPFSLADYENYLRLAQARGQ